MSGDEEEESNLFYVDDDDHGEDDEANFAAVMRTARSNSKKSKKAAPSSSKASSLILSSSSFRREDHFSVDSGTTEDFDSLADEVEGLDVVSQFLSDEALKDLAGTDDLDTVKYLEIRIDTEAITMRDLGARLPAMMELKLNNSNVPSIRDLGTSFSNLKVLWLARSNVKELDGISAFSSIRELYLSFNDISDLSPLGACEALEILDLEGNNITELSDIHYLSACGELRQLTLEGSPISFAAEYRSRVAEALPNLRILDDIPTSDADALSAAARLLHLPPHSEEKLAEIEPLDVNRLLQHARMSASDIVSLDSTQDSLHESSILEELEMVRKGIKYGRVGYDDPNFLTPDEMDDLPLRPGTARSRRPMSASLVNGSRPLSATARPQSARRPLSASFSSNRTPTSYGRQSSAARPTSSYGRGSQAGHSDEPASTRSLGEFGEASSSLTFGSEEVFCGNPVMALRSRKSEWGAALSRSAISLSALSRSAAIPNRSDLSLDELLDELKRWKMQTASIAMMSDPEEAGSERIGAEIGGANAERLVLPESPRRAYPDRKSGRPPIRK